MLVSALLRLYIFFTSTVVTLKRMPSASEALQQYALSYLLPPFADTHELSARLIGDYIQASADGKSGLYII